MKFIVQIVVAALTIVHLNAYSTPFSKTKMPPTNKSFFNYEYDSVKDKHFLSVDKLDSSFIMVHSLSSGLGSNDIGLDRGKLGGTRIVRFKRYGNKLLLIQPNLYYRAQSKDKAERNAVKESFASSVIWGFNIVSKKMGVIKIDISDFLLHDHNKISTTLQNRGEGNYQVDRSRSAVNSDRTKAFPRNNEFDVLLTFSGSASGQYVPSVTPSSNAITLHQHISFIALPPKGFKMRKHHPRSGFYSHSFMDYASTIESPMIQRFIYRHRLEKKFPNAAQSEAVEPLVYYVDNGTPEPIRSALVDGARWWNSAFEAAGFKNAFIVKILPEGADPMDVRYNVIQWVHRSTRGWSYGGSVYDPRTGEIIKGHVSLGSLRVRQDYLIATGLLAPYKEDGTYSNAMKEMALARLRQLSAHEVGHTLGIMHNFAASSNNRSSVMDYPQPKFKLSAHNKIELDDAYGIGIGAWDKAAIMYGYSQFKDEEMGLQNVIDNMTKDGLDFVSDRDARPTSSAQPNGHLWDNGKDATVDLEHMLKVRAVALNNFSEHTIPLGTPYSEIEKVFVPTYLMHRYALEATAKLIGGRAFNYALRGERNVVHSSISKKQQIKALKGLNKALLPQQLLVPHKIRSLLLPPAPGYYKTRESFKGQTDPIFDVLTPAQNIIDHVHRLFFNGVRLNRVMQNHLYDEEQPSLSTLFELWFKAHFEQEFNSAAEKQLQMLVQNASVKHVMALHAQPITTPYLRSALLAHLQKWEKWFKEAESDDTLVEAHYKQMRMDIKNYFKNPEKTIHSNPSSLPPGSPIGSGQHVEYGCGL